MGASGGRGGRNGGRSLPQAWDQPAELLPVEEEVRELLFEMLSQRYERGSTMVTSNLPFQEWTEVLGSERLTGALLDRLTHHVHILEMNGDSYRLKQSRRKRTPSSER